MSIWDPANGLRYLKGRLTGVADESSQPAVEFEKAAQVRGIAGSYTFPGQRSAKDFDHWAKSFCSFRDGDDWLEKKHLQKTWNSLVALNPELDVVKPDGNPVLLRYGIFGAASQFNPDDIRFFIEMQKRTNCSPTALLVHQIPAYEKMNLDIQSRTGVQRLWVASPETLLHIHEQVKDRPAQYEAKRAFTDAATARDMPSPAIVEAAHDYIKPVLSKAGPGF
ncbi:MAG: hypothetical protein ACXW30_01590 [Micavibrio sp.]